MKKKRVFIIGLVWPEPTSSAAGTRIIQLIQYFLASNHQVIFASAACKSEFSFDLTALEVTECEIKLNDNRFNSILNEINPNIVLFDRFVMEEQYGWRVQQECPNALKILDTEDLHTLRYARKQALKEQKPLEKICLFNEIAKREIASILRCDLSLMISETEMDILQQRFRIDPSILAYLPFLEETITEKQIQAWKPFEQREGFTFIGNFLHEPNWRTVQILKTRIWPQLRKKLPDLSLHIYGAYASQKVLQLHNKRERFYVHGRAEDAQEVLSNHRVLLAPIPFGAGVKGKFIDAMQVGTPSVTTSVGAEAMKGALAWNGMIEDNDEDFIAQAIHLYSNEESWLQAQQNGVLIINERYDKTVHYPSLTKRLTSLSLTLPEHRQHNFLGQILQYHTVSSTKYMSLWIEEKNKKGHQTQQAN